MKALSKLPQRVTAREEAIADLAALRAALGLALSEMSTITVGYALAREALNRLFNLADEIQDGKIELLNAKDAETLYNDTKTLRQQVCSTFSPGGPGFPTTARLYLARALCLKAEISLRRLARTRLAWWSLKREHVNPHSLSYLECLSTYLLTMAMSGAFESPRH